MTIVVLSILLAVVSVTGLVLAHRLLGAAAEIERLTGRGGAR